MQLLQVSPHKKHEGDETRSYLKSEGPTLHCQRAGFRAVAAESFCQLLLHLLQAGFQSHLLMSKLVEGPKPAAGSELIISIQKTACLH